MRPLLTIARREFRSYFDAPLAYVVICMSFLALGGVFFFYRGGFWQLNRASLQMMFEYAPIGLSVLVVPAVTIVAAWISALTGVGPAIASGSHT